MAAGGMTPNGAGAPKVTFDHATREMKVDADGMTVAEVYAAMQNQMRPNRSGNCAACGGAMSYICCCTSLTHELLGSCRETGQELCEPCADLLEMENRTTRCVQCLPLSREEITAVRLEREAKGMEPPQRRTPSGG